MKYFRHQTNWYVVPMLIVDGNPGAIIDYIWDTSTSVDNTITKNFLIEDRDVCNLDPGGMYNIKIPHKEFIINNIKFDVQLSRIEDVLYCMKKGKERVPGYIRFSQWKCHVIISKLMFLKLEEKLRQLDKTDEAMNAELTERLIYDDLIKTKYIISPKYKKNI